MNKTILFLYSFVLMGLLCACHSSKISSTDNSVEKLYFQMAGQYDNLEQAETDTAFRKISLVMKPIWRNRPGEYWLYVEQALFSRKDKPYRQRVYRVYSKNNQWISEVYTLNNPLRFTGCWKESEPLKQLTPDSLELKAGCEVILQKAGKNYVGKTDDKTCPSELYGASFATSEVQILSDRLISWDRGFDNNGKQVWGSEKGGYIFIRRSALK